MITKKIRQNGGANTTDVAYEKGARKRACEFVRSFDTFIDVGANVGIWALPLRSKFKNVIAFEPCSKNLECLYHNLHLKDGQIDNVHVYETALGDKNETGLIRPGGKNCGNTQVVGESESQHVLGDGSQPVTGREVEMRTLDSYEFSNIDLLKIDTQGHEWCIINGALESIKRCRPVVVFESDGKSSKGIRRFGKGELDTMKLLKDIGMKDVTSLTKTDKIFAFK